MQFRHCPAVVGPVSGTWSVVLRPLQESDADVHFAQADGELARWLTGGRPDREQNAAYFAGITERWDTGAKLSFGIADSATGALTGTLDIDRALTCLEPGQATRPVPPANRQPMPG